MMHYAVTLSPIGAGKGGGYISGGRRPKTINVTAISKQEAINQARAEGAKQGLDWWAITNVQEVSKGIQQ